MIDKDTGKAIQVAMINADLTVAELAKRLNKNPATVSRWRTSGCNSITVMQQIARECGISLAELMGHA